MDAWMLVSFGLLLIWVGYDFLFQKDLVRWWATARNRGKILPRTPASDRRSTLVGVVFVLGGLALVIWAGWRLL